jgi:hypothetical protein
MSCQPVSRRSLFSRTVAAAALAAGLGLLATVALGAEGASPKPGPFRAGAYAMDITPDWFPIVVNGGFQPHYAQKAVDPLHARCLVLDDGRSQVAIVIVDSCVFDQAAFDAAKEAASKLTGIPTDRMFMSTTHCHSAPAVVGALGTDPDERYRSWVPGKIAEGVHRAQKNLAPAQVGWAVGCLPDLPHSRRWIARPDKIKEDPFGELTTRATMHPGYRNPDWEEPSGPMNPDVPVLAVRRPGGAPIAVYSSFSIHYVGAPALSADYFGVFARRIGELIGAGKSDPAFVGMLANGVSGDAYLNDYSLKVPKKYDMNSIGETVAQEAAAAYRRIEWKDWLPLVMKEENLELMVRPPRVEWGKKIMDQIKKEGRPLKSLTDFYAREQLLLAEMPPTRNLKLQALRIGTLGIVGIPCEVYAVTGLRINQQSPLDYTFSVMLANGWTGYLPPPEQIVMGGYNSWLARSSCLEPEAEPKIIARVLPMLDAVAGDYRATRKVPAPGPYAAAVLASKPAVYWRLDDIVGPTARDAVSGKGLGKFDIPVSYYMPGPRAAAFPGLEADNRAVHFIGKPLAAHVQGLGPAYTVEMWFYDCMPTDARPVTGYLFSRGAAGDHLAIGGVGCGPGKLIFHAGGDPAKALTGKTDVPLRNWVPRESWHHVALVREGRQVTVYLDGRQQPELSGQADPAPAGDEIFLGGSGNGQYGFEGRIDEAAIYGRALTAEEVKKHYSAATGP